MFSKYLFIILVLFCATTRGACFPDIMDYSLQAEIDRASAVVIATPISDEWVNDEKEPDFYAGAIYQLEIHQTLYSQVQGNIELWDPNNSGRFAPDLGSRYLFILHENTSGKLAADYCGNSGLLEDKKDLLPGIRELISDQ